jgi:hypothetical protein
LEVPFLGTAGDYRGEKSACGARRRSGVEEKGAKLLGRDIEGESIPSGSEEGERRERKGGKGLRRSHLLRGDHE